MSSNDKPGKPSQNKPGKNKHRHDRSKKYGHDRSKKYGRKKNNKKSLAELRREITERFGADVLNDGTEQDSKSTQPPDLDNYMRKLENEKEELANKFQAVADKIEKAKKLEENRNHQRAIARQQNQNDHYIDNFDDAEESKLEMPEKFKTPMHREIWLNTNARSIATKIFYRNMRDVLRYLQPSNVDQGALHHLKDKQAVIEAFKRALNNDPTRISPMVRDYKKDEENEEFVVFITDNKFPDFDESKYGMKTGATFMFRYSPNKQVKIYHAGPQT
ncbi:hypothetical protein QGP82_06315 [Leptothoe sp. LEGE 181152]|nr:hypothetical protein [Leptothoe sp. LEGE 181152]